MLFIEGEFVMAKRIDDYVVVQGNNIDELQKEVMSFLRSHDGYELIGGMIANCPNVYCQTLVKY